MMKEQGLCKQPPLLPSPPPPSSTITKNTQSSSSSFTSSSSSAQSSSFTNSLITSNLSMISSPTSPPQQPGQMTGLGNTGLSYGMRPSFLQQQPFRAMNSWGASPTQPQSWVSPLPVQQQQQQQPAPLNMGAFDNLLPSQPRPPSLNQMASPTMMTPMRPMSMVSTPAPVRPLTSSDINDLLS